VDLPLLLPIRLPLLLVFDLLRAVVGHYELHVEPRLRFAKPSQLVLAYLPSVPTGVEVPGHRRIEPHRAHPFLEAFPVFVADAPDHALCALLDYLPDGLGPYDLRVVLPKVRAPRIDEVQRRVELLRYLV